MNVLASHLTRLDRDSVTSSWLIQAYHRSHDSSAAGHTVPVSITVQLRMQWAAQLATCCMSVPTRTAHALAWFCSTTCHLLHVRAHTHCSCTRLVLQHNLPLIACPCPHALLMHSLGFPQAWTCLMSCTATVTLALSIASGLRAGMPQQSKVSWLMSFAATGWLGKGHQPAYL
jgi:hypothetical protein